MKEQLSQEIERFTAEDPANRFPESASRYFDTPLIRFAAAGDPLFTDYKTIIGNFHLTPQEMFSTTLGAISRPPR